MKEGPSMMPVRGAVTPAPVPGNVVRAEVLPPSLVVRPRTGALTALLLPEI